MNRKLLLLFGGFLVLVIAVVSTFFISQLFCPTANGEDDTDTGVPMAMMLLIEFRNTDGLVNMVNDMRERGIKGILMVNADFVDANVEVIKEVLRTGVVEIAASYDPKPYWEMTYDEQYSTITDMLTRIESALDVDIRIISSRYMASDENTVKIADGLGIEYITARGTTELATTVYKPEEYNVKIISVSNIDVPEFKYGSFCDYSFYERSGSPEDMTREFERAITEEKFMGVSHTYIGGYKERWNQMWHNFWDNYSVNWVDLDTIGTVDKVMPMWQIPINKNAPYTPEKIRPAIPYDEEQNVVNPCLVEDLAQETTDYTSTSSISAEQIVIFHNNTGPMCVDLLEYLRENDVQYIEYLTTDSDFDAVLSTYRIRYPVSSGISANYGYYPFIFTGGKSFSGFDDDIQAELDVLLNLE